MLRRLVAASHQRMPFYAVNVGRRKGIYDTWEACQQQTLGYPRASFKKFATRASAAAFVLHGNSGGGSGGGDDRDDSAAAAAPAAGNRGRNGGGASSGGASSDGRDTQDTHGASAADHRRGGGGGGGGEGPTPFKTLHGRHTPPSDCFILRSDGGSRGNPGVGGAGAVLLAPGSRSLVFEAHEYHAGSVTNNQMEYTGLLLGLRACVDAGVKALLVEGDSQLIIRQLEGAYAVNAPTLLAAFAEAKRLISQGGFSYVGARHIYREDNSHADSLCNRAMDSGSSGASWNNRVLDEHGLRAPGPGAAAAAAAAAARVKPAASYRGGGGGGRGGGGGGGGAVPAFKTPAAERYKRPRSHDGEGGAVFGYPGSGGKSARR